MSDKKTKTDKKAKWAWSTGNWVVAYAIGYMILTVIYCLPTLLARLTLIDVSDISANFTFPLEIFAWGLLAICAGYSGVDRAAFATKSSFMEMGTCDMGEPEKLRKVIYILLAIFIESMLLNFFFGVEYEADIYVWNSAINDYEDSTRVYPAVNIPLEGVSSALVSTISIYILGNKSIRLTQNVDATKENQAWANEKEDNTFVRDKDSKRPEEPHKKEPPVDNNEKSREQFNERRRPREEEPRNPDNEDNIGK